MPTITKTGKRETLYQHQMWVNFTLLERLFIEYYAEQYNCDDSAVLRGMLRKFTAKDRTFDPTEFIKTAEKTLIPREASKEVRAAMKKELAKYKQSAASDNAGRST